MISPAIIRAPLLVWELGLLVTVQLIALLVADIEAQATFELAEDGVQLVELGVTDSDPAEAASPTIRLVLLNEYEQDSVVPQPVPVTTTR
jgi:hypothetical protein